jgi:hypothetical protein
MKRSGSMAMERRIDTTPNAGIAEGVHNLVQIR